MSLKQKIFQELVVAMKNRSVERVKALRLLSSAIKNKEIEIRPKPLTDEHTISVLRKQVKQIQESLVHYKAANYTDQIKQEEFELSVFNSFLPKALPVEELKKLVSEAISETQASSIKDMGAVMKLAKLKSKGMADGQQLSQLVKAKLSQL